MNRSGLSTRLCVAFIFMFIVSSLSTLMAQAARSKPTRASGVSIRTIAGQPSVFDEGNAGSGKIVFQRGFATAASLVLLDLSNGAETPLGSGSTPAFSPDGSQIAFERNGEIMLMNADGSNPHSLAMPAVGQHPTWSPDGAKLAFVKVGPTNFLGDIYVMDASGNHQTPLTTSGRDHSPAWGASNQIAFVRHITQADIFVMNADGSQQTNISNTAADDYDPAWSPLGAMISFASMRDSNQGEIYTMDASGGRVMRVTNDSFADEEPAFSSDGTKLIWSSGSRPGASNNKVFVMDVSGSNPRQLSAGSSFDTAPASSTSAATCAISYSDLQPSDPFYGYVQCLACRGLVGGFSDGTFRPFNNLTRAQAIQVITLAAKFDDGVTGQTFADVPPANPFYIVVERAALHGIISGNACGGTGEPCDAQSRPYFRPFNDITRGQFAKSLAAASGYSETVTGQTFSDVSPDNPFYLYIERLALHGVASGYVCGGPNEPCDAQNRQYFRWANIVTRGQASKMISGAFFPNCAGDSGSGPVITSVTRQGKHLLIEGHNFDAGAVILLNGEKRKTIHDDPNSTTVLRGKKLVKMAQFGDKLKVRNADGAESPEVTYQP